MRREPINCVSTHSAWGDLVGTLTTIAQWLAIRFNGLECAWRLLCGHFMNTTRPLLLLSAVLATVPAAAQTSLEEVTPRTPPGATSSTESWRSSVLTGRTVGAGRFVVHPEIGYPGISAGLLWGTSARSDVGLRLSAGFATRLGFLWAPTLGAQAVLRWNFIDQGIVSLGSRFEPGVFIGPYTAGDVLLLAPFGLDLGIHPHPIVNVALGLDVGLGAAFDYRGGVAFVVPVQFGPGLELNLTDALALTLNTRVGAGWSEPLASYRGYGLRATLGLAFRN